jgi:acyl-CoA reductase-like NAD-dependent aldehyde dehydrogenase
MDHPHPHLLQEAVHDAFSEQLVSKVRKLRIGSGLDPGTTQGPLITNRAVEGVSESAQRWGDRWPATAL